MDEQTILDKAQRLSRITLLLYRHPKGLTAVELARMCNVTPRTIQRDLRALEEMGIPLWDDSDEEMHGRAPRYGILGGYYLPPIHLTLDDALALYLAARLLARHADSYDPHIAEALAKLAGILPEPIADHVHATIRNLVSRPEDERFSRVLSTLALGWATRRAVRIHHRAAQSEHVHEQLLCPYFIEPSAVGHATYVIGYASYFQGLRTFKVERILEAELTDHPFQIPEDFDGPALLESAWGIEYGEELEEVVLRFAPSATRRVKETCWHRSQRLEDTPDGGCIMRLTLANPQEMVYWVRSWGPQVEVLAPAWMREQLMREVEETRRMYERSL